MFEIILKFLYSTWQDIIISLVGGLLSTFFLTYSIKKYITSAEKERLKQAKNSLLGILEDRIKNKQDISVDKINNFLKATERKHSVDLSSVVSLSSLLRDLQLQFENNPHLDPDKKDEYYEQIENLTQEIRPSGQLLFIPKKYSEIIETLTEEIKSKNTESALEILEILNKKIIEWEKYIEGPGSITVPTYFMGLMIASIYLLLTIFNIDFIVAILMSFTIIIFIVIIASIIPDSLKSVINR